jgi:AraC-like DNA-binding protein
MTAHDNRLAPRASLSGSTPHAADSHDTRELRGMLGTLEQLGYDLDGLLASARLCRADVEDPEAYVSPSACARVFARARQERRVPNLALHLALRTPVGTSPLLDYLIVSSDSVGQGLQRLARYLRLVNPAIRVAVDDVDDPADVVVDSGGDPFGAELTVSMSVVRFMRETDDQLKVAYVTFTHDPDDVSEYARVLRCPVRTGESWNGWALPKESLRLSLRRRDPALRRWLERQAADMLARLPAGNDVIDDVRRVLATQVTAGDITIDVVARRLATTPRTLQRRLARTGTSFDALRDDMRKQAAEVYLADATLSITEVAYLLGYSEPGALHRAFKRWYGMTPEAFRQKQHGSLCR